MTTFLVNNTEIEIDDQQRLNAIQAAALAGVEIPHYCWHPALSVVGSCRMCLVEVGSRDASGKIAMFPKPVPACNTIVGDGTVLVTESEKIQVIRAQVEEKLLLDHPVDCPICDKAGECKLQDYYFAHGQSRRRADLHPFTSRRRDLGDVTFFADRCIMCTRCVRFTRQISGTSELMIQGRGAGEEIAVMDGFPLANKLSGNVVDLCPVGALGDKDFLYRQRVWFLRRHPGVCTGCATGCSIWVEENQDRIHRIKPRENPAVNRWWICNDGRYGYPHVHDPRRLLGARRRDGGQTVELDWSSLPDELGSRLGHVGGRLAAILSPMLTVEEAYLLARFLRGLDSQAVLALGPVPTAGRDETFPGGFTISAEKCPNRAGVEAVLRHFTGRVTTFDQFVDQLGRGEIRAAWVSGGYKTDWIDPRTAARFEPLRLLIVQDLFRSPLSERAKYELAGAAFAERAGSYVNRQGLLQTAARAIRPPGGVRAEGTLYWELLAREGLYHAETVLEEWKAASAGQQAVGSPD